jgi:hypothetical protein
MPVRIIHLIAIGKRRPRLDGGTGRGARVRPPGGEDHGRMIKKPGGRQTFGAGEGN